MINFLSSIDWQDVGNGAIAALRTLLLKICEPIYNLIIFCFDIFEDFGKVRLFAESDTISLIYTRIGLILGLFMVFRLTFAAIEYLINPDKMMDSKSGIGNIIKKVLIVIVLLGSTRYLFNFAFKLQDKLIDSNIVGNLILGPSYDESEKDNSGENLAWYTFSQFYKINTKVNIDDNNRKNCETMLNGGSIQSEFLTNHNLDNAEYCLNLQSKDKYELEDELENVSVNLNIINFNGFICLAVGLILLWIIIVYTVQVSVRVFQLAYLELIAPIPIMMYLMPNGDEKLKKWGQQCLTTFLDFFIRLAIMNFIILVSNALIELTEESNILLNFGELNTWGVGYITIILIIGLLMFAKKVPELLKEIFPSTGGKAGFSFGLGTKEAKGLATFGLGAGIGAVAGAATGIKYGAGTKGGRIGGALTGLVRGGLSGAKTKGNIFKNVSGGMANQRSAMQRAYDRNNDGSTFWGRTIGAGDAARTKAAFDEELSFYDSYSKNADIVDNELSKNANVKAVMAEQQSLMSRAERGGPLPTASEIAAMDQKVKAIKQTALQQEMNKRGTDQENKTLMSAIQNAEAMRTKAVQKGYAGFEKYSNTKIDDYADSFLDSVKDVKAEVGNIKDVSGSRNKAYKEAEANAKYAKNK